MSAPVEVPVGRSPEVGRLVTMLEDVVAGGSRAVAVEGEAGIGKTHLLAHLRRTAEDDGHLVLTGSASEFERDLPFGPWVQALDAYVASVEAVNGRLDGLDTDALSDVLPSLRRPARPLSALDERHRTHRAVRELLVSIASTHPVVLILDDLHWSDDASVELIAALVRRPIEGAVMLALGYRSGKAPERLTAALLSAEIEPMELGALDLRESTALMGSAISGRDAASIYRESGGNPFYTLQMARVRTKPTRSVHADRVAADTGVPRLVASAILEELRALTVPARTLLESGAIAGDPFDIDLASAISELPADRVLGVLDELLAERLLHPTDVPRRFAFRHPLMRRAVYESTAVGWRLGAHARAARALAPVAQPAAAAHHVEQSASPGDAVAIELLLRAGAVSAPRDPVGAARWFTAALRLIPDEHRPARLDVLVRLAAALRHTDLEASAAVLLQAMDIAPDDDVAMRLRLSSSYADCQNFLGDHGRAEAQLRSALEAYTDPGSTEAVTVLMDLTMGAFFTLDEAAMCRLAYEAREAAQQTGDPALLLAASCALAHATSVAGRAAEAAEAIGAACALVDPLPAAALVSYLEPLNRLTYAELTMGRYRDAARHAERGVDAARSTGGLAYAPLTLAGNSLSLTMLGDFDSARVSLDEALEIAEVGASDYVLCSVLSTGTFAALVQGDFNRAVQLSDRGARLAGDLRGSRIAMMTRAASAVARRLGGATTAETAELVAEAGGWTLSGIPAIPRALALELVVKAELEAERIDAAEEAVLAVETAAESIRAPIAELLAHRARSRLLLARADERAAAELALAAAGRAAAVDFPVEVGRLRAVAGEALLAYDRARGVEALRAAEAIFDAHGALRDRAEVRRRLRQVGVRVEPRRRSHGEKRGDHLLSEREREIADMVFDRKTNREIAAELFLSTKTVETHLRNIFAKLGVSSRVEVARSVQSERDAGASLKS